MVSYLHWTISVMEEEIFCSHSIETYSSYGFAFHMKDGLRCFCWNQCLWTYRIVMSYSPSWYFVMLRFWPRNLFCSKWSVATSSYWWNSLVLPSYPSLWSGGMVLLTIQLLLFLPYPGLGVPKSRNRNGKTFSHRYLSWSTCKICSAYPATLGSAGLEGLSPKGQVFLLEDPAIAPLNWKLIMVCWPPQASHAKEPTNRHGDTELVGVIMTIREKLDHY